MSPGRAPKVIWEGAWRTPRGFQVSVPLPGLGGTSAHTPALLSWISCGERTVVWARVTGLHTHSQTEGEQVRQRAREGP